MALKITNSEVSCPDKNNDSDKEESPDTSNSKRKTKSGKKNSKRRLSPKFFNSINATGSPLYQKRTTLPTMSVLPIMPVSTTTPYYPQYTCPNLTYPFSNWSNATAIQLQNPVYNIISFQSVPVILTPPVIYPYSSAVITPPILTPAPSVISDDLSLPSFVYENTYCSGQSTPAVCQAETSSHNSTNTSDYESIDNSNKGDPLEVFLSLPKDIFPTARMLALDPNPIIDQFCKIINVHNHASWILDLEFGVPRVPITRPIATYDVKFHSVHCKNTPSAIHPGFESCSQDFKEVLLFYYDCVISAWYRGYVLMTCDVSVENFQSWMLTPVQVFGMCWP